MKDKTRRLQVVRMRGVAMKRQRDIVSMERPVTIFLNDVEIAALLCSPADLDYLAVGFLFSEGLIKGKKDIKRIFSDSKEGGVWVETAAGEKPKIELLGRRLMTTGCGRGMTFTGSDKELKALKVGRGFRLHAGSVAPLMKEFQSRSEVFRKTGGVHSAGLADQKRIIFFNEDIGRHNAIDKVLGECILKGVRPQSLVIITSGRVSSDILTKAARSGVPVILSKSAPTDLAVMFARSFGVTLIGFARGSRMNVYSGGQRISQVTRSRIRTSRSRGHRSSRLDRK